MVWCDLRVRWSEQILSPAAIYALERIQKKNVCLLIAGNINRKFPAPTQGCRLQVWTHTHTHTHPTLYHHWPPSPVSSGLSTTQQLKSPWEKVMQVTAKCCFSIGTEQRTKRELLTLSFSIYPKISVLLKLIESSTAWSMKGVNPDLGQSLKNTMYSISISYPAANQEPWKCFWTEGRYHHI